MGDEAEPDAALRPLAPGPLISIGNDRLQVRIAPLAGGRLVQVAFYGMEWLSGHEAGNEAAIAWGCYPMLPWAGRIRRGHFHFGARDITLPPNLGMHAIHGVGFVLPWQVDAQAMDRLEMLLQLPRDSSWPFGGVARQRVALAQNTLRLELSVTAGESAMPWPVLGWHPWFRKPTQLQFAPTLCYPRDGEGIATLPLAPPAAGPRDDCFINSRPVTLHRDGQSLQLRSSCDHWVVFDERAHATCVEPQTGPPDAFNLMPGRRLAPGQTVAAWFELEWQGAAPAGDPCSSVP